MGRRGGKFESACGRTASERAARVDRDRSARRTQRCGNTVWLRYEAEDSRDAEMPGRGLQDGGKGLVGGKTKSDRARPRFASYKIVTPRTRLERGSVRESHSLCLTAMALAHGGSRRDCGDGLFRLAGRERIWLRLGSQARAMSLAARNSGSRWLLTSDLRRYSTIFNNNSVIPSKITLSRAVFPHRRATCRPYTPDPLGDFPSIEIIGNSENF